MTLPKTLQYLWEKDSGETEGLGREFRREKSEVRNKVRGIGQQMKPDRKVKPRENFSQKYRSLFSWQRS